MKDLTSRYPKQYTDSSMSRTRQLPKRKKSSRRTAETRLAQNREVIASWIQRHSLAVFISLLMVGSLRIVTTYDVFSHTSDEPAHIATGLEWLTKGTYRYEVQHPPLARVAVALGPYLAGERTYGKPDFWTEGLADLYGSGHYDRNLTLARLGVLPFFWVGCLVVYLWARRYYGEPSAAFAVLCFTSLPPILAHAGLATTDMALAAMVSASFLAVLVWLDRPSLVNTLFFGGTTGLAVLSKFSALPFIPASMAAAAIWYVLRERHGLTRARKVDRGYVMPLLGAVLFGALVIWAGYRFSFGHVNFASLRLPAPELYAGIQTVIDHNNEGHVAYLLGMHSMTGWWYYFPVVLAVKTPLAFLALLFYGAFCLKRRDATQENGMALAFPLGILLFSVSSHINIGVRHILPVYTGFSIVAGAGAARLLEKSRKTQAAGWALGILLLWLTAASVLSHPDYLPYFNALAGGEPEKVLVDSDLDWGQDLKRLAKRLGELGAKQVAFFPFFTAHLKAHGMPPVQPLNPLTPSPGWNAANLTALKAFRFNVPLDYPPIWPEQVKPMEKVGKGIVLWYIPPNSHPAP